MTTTVDSSFLSTRRGKLTLILLCAVGFLDFVDTSIVNVALPSIRKDLNFSVQNLQWVLSAYLLTYGGFLLLGDAPLTCWVDDASLSPAPPCSPSPPWPAAWRRIRER